MGDSAIESNNTEYHKIEPDMPSTANRACLDMVRDKNGHAMLLSTNPSDTAKNIVAWVGALAIMTTVMALTVTKIQDFTDGKFHEGNGAVADGNGHSVNAITFLVGSSHGSTSVIDPTVPYFLETTGVSRAPNEYIEFDNCHGDDEWRLTNKGSGNSPPSYFISSCLPTHPVSGTPPPSALWWLLPESSGGIEWTHIVASRASTYAGYNLGPFNERGSVYPKVFYESKNDTTAPDQTPMRYRVRSARIHIHAYISTYTYPHLHIHIYISTYGYTYTYMHIASGLHKSAVLAGWTHLGHAVSCSSTSSRGQVGLASHSLLLRPGYAWHLPDMHGTSRI